MRAFTRALFRRLASWEFECFPHRPFGIFRRAYLRAMRVKHGLHMSMGTDIYIRDPGNLILGNRCAIGSFARIWNYSEVTIGDDFMSAGGLVINSATHDPITLQSKTAPVRIGDRVWCGLNVVILSGVTVGDDVVIGAGSIVIHDIPSKSIAAGVPAKVVKPLVRERTPDHPLFLGQT